jgi:hypothetical protein
MDFGMSEPTVQVIRPAGFESFDTSREGDLPEWRALRALLVSPSGRKALTVAMLATETPDACFGRVLQFCKAKSKADLLQGEPLLWVRRLIARAANVRAT